MAQTLQTLFTTDAEACARDAGFVRRRQLTGPAFAQALVFGWLDQPQATLENLAVTAFAAGAEVTPHAIDRRFTAAAADFFGHLLARAVAAVWHTQPQAAPLLQRFQGVYLVDATTIRLPAALAPLWPAGGNGSADDQAALKVQVRWELTGARLDALSVLAGTAAEGPTPWLRPPCPRAPCAWPTWATSTWTPWPPMTSRRSGG